ncbi:serine hydrolase domain-containing protein [Actinomadura litoris]|uniref:Serine hydrolase n=1 Tax=Actinomadura litoris TaxID=2678616 RepID=A0A7K1LBY4_9ACTN|nr:serine hydrolase domain-containing protein [Actinomadura litoris]MUN41937.1 serine hydrolase [Actinomadura litoris]
MAFSPAPLDAMRDAMAGHIERGALPGLVTVVSRRGETRVEALGAASVGGPPMSRGTLFRITSMTKPIAAVAALTLVEEGVLRLDDPVDALLPELAGRRVLRAPEGPLEDTVPAARPITLRDLLTFRCGLGIALDGSLFGTPFDDAVRELGLMGFGPPRPDAPHTADEWLGLVGTLPLQCQPGERWLYNTGYVILGILIARASGRPLEAFLRERLFEPLGMRDTGFHVPAADQGRLADSYSPDDADGRLTVYDGADGRWSRPPAFPDAGAGLVSSADDYLAFARMLADGGAHGGAHGGGRLLSRRTVELMTTDQLAPGQHADALGEARGWGFGVSVVLRRDEPYATPGRYGWNGGFGTSWANDPAEDLTAILLTQRPMPPGASPVRDDFWTSVYRSLA